MSNPSTKYSPTAKQLAADGYRRVSNRGKIIARVDRPDWQEYMAEKHCPWDADEGMAWVNGLGSGAADFYRRVYSKDHLRVSPELFKLIPASDHDPIGFTRSDPVE